MKRRPCLLAAVLLGLLLSLLLVLSALAAPTCLTDLCCSGRDIYAFQAGDILIYDAPSQDFLPTGLQAGSGACLVDSLDALWIWDVHTQALTALDPASGSQSARYQLRSGLAERPCRAVLSGDILYLLAQDFSSDTFLGVTAIDIHTGQLFQSPLSSIADIALTADGELALYQTPLGQPGALYTWKAGSSPLRQADAPGNMLLTTPPGGMALDLAENRLLVQANQTLWDLSGNAPAEVAYLTAYEYAELLRGAYSQGTYFELYSDGTWRAQRTDTSQQVLRIAGLFPDAACLQAFREAHPEIAVVYSSMDVNSDTALAEAIINNTLDADILILNTDSNLYHAIIQKGYALPLRSVSLSENVQRMYPVLQQELMVNGEVYALPLTLGGNTMFYNAALFDALQLPVPATVEELLSFCATANLPDDAQLHQRWFMPLSEILLRYLCDLYLDSPDQVDSPALLSALSQWESCCDAIDARASDSSESPALFRYGSELYPWERPQENERILILNDSKGEPLPFPINLSVALVYARSSQPDTCLSFLNFCAEHQDDAFRIAAHPDENEPLPALHTAQQLQSIQEAMLPIQQALANQPDSLTLQQQLEELQLEYAQLEAHPWRISEEQILAYRREVPFFALRERRWGYDTQDVQLHQLLTRLKTHQISAQQFVESYLAIGQMMLLESN